MTPSHMQPSDEQWTLKKDQIETLYLERDLPLKTVQEHLAAQGFAATVRQYKTRLKAWGFDTKRIKSIAWCAMSAELTARDGEHMNTVFYAPVRGETIKITPERVIRQSKRRNRRATSKHDLPNLIESRTILRKFGIEACDEIPLGVTMLPWPQYYGTESEMLGVQGIQSRHGADLPHYRQSTPEDLSNAESSPVSTLSNLSTWSKGDLMDLHPLVSQATTTAVLGFTACVMPLRDLSSTQPGPFIGNSAYDIDNSPPVTIIGSIDRYDMATTLALASPDPECESVTCETFQRCMGICANLTGQSITIDRCQLLAAQWVTPYLLESIGRRNNLHMPGLEAREGAKSAFRELLSQSNEYIFPFCNSVLAVLVSSNQVDLATLFLTECCEVIDDEELKHELLYGTPFHFALAWYTHNPQRMARCIDDFEKSSQVVLTRWGAESPNYIVCRYYHIWYTINKKQYDQALEMLLCYREISERVLGPTHVISVNCLVMISRVFEETGHKGEALGLLHDATMRLSSVAGLLESYKFRVQLRLAKLQTDISEYVAAKTNFNSVLDYRLGCFGLLDNSTWFVIRALADLMRLQGCQRESKSFDQRWTELWQEQAHRAADGYLEQHDTRAQFLCLICQRPHNSPGCCSGDLEILPLQSKHRPSRKAFHTPVAVTPKLDAHI